MSSLRSPWRNDNKLEIAGQPFQPRDAFNCETKYLQLENTYKYIKIRRKPKQKRKKKKEKKKEKRKKVLVSVAKKAKRSVSNVVLVQPNIVSGSLSLFGFHFCLASTHLGCGTDPSPPFSWPPFSSFIFVFSSQQHTQDDVAVQYRKLGGPVTSSQSITHTPSTPFTAL